MVAERPDEKTRMSAVSVPVLAMAAITFYVGVYHAMLYVRRRRNAVRCAELSGTLQSVSSFTPPAREDLTFAITCFVVAFYDLCSLGLYGSTSVAEGVEWQRIQVATLALFGIAFLWFASDYAGIGSRRVLLGMSAYFVFSAVFGLLDRSSLTWQVDVPAIKEVRLPFGLELTYYEAKPGPFVLFQSIVGLASFGYIVWIALRLRATGQGKKALPLLTCMTLFFAGLFNDTAISSGLYSFVYLIEYAYLSLILLMAYRLSTDLIEAGEVRDALASSEEQLRQAQKMESIGRLAGGIAHDFNNMLTPILGYSAITLKALHEDDPLRQNLVDIRDAAREAADLTSQLLAFSRKQTLEMRVLDLNVVLSEFEPILRRLIREDIEMRFRLDPSLACARADPTQIRQIAMNLALNARDAMPDGGLLEFETANLTIDVAGGARFEEVKPGEYVSLCVRDSGAGMDAETIRQLFEPFFTTKEQGKGTGLGLATIHGIVNQHGGHVSVESEPGHGTCFRILLPQNGSLPDAVTAGPETGEVVGGSETVLIVEDDRKVRNLARDILAGHGYRVITAKGVHEAARIASDPGLSVDLLLTDVVMPYANGFELYARIAAIRPGIRVLFMSGYAEGTAREHGALTAGAHFMRKPFAPDDLARKIRGALDAA